MITFCNSETVSNEAICTFWWSHLVLPVLTLSFTINCLLKRESLMIGRVDYYIHPSVTAQINKKNKSQREPRSISYNKFWIKIFYCSGRPLSVLQRPVLAAIKVKIYCAAGIYFWSLSICRQPTSSHLIAWIVIPVSLCHCIATQAVLSEPFIVFS